jgi:CubicO group peptidase (beta-lactamase class C family)
MTMLSAPPARAVTEQEVGPIAQITLDAAVEPRAVPGVTAGIAFKDGVTWQGAAGYSNSDHTMPMQPLDQMRIGSQTKTYTATVVLELTDKGILKLGQTLYQLMPELHVPNDRQITLVNLLDMTSGIPDYLISGSLHMPGKTVLDEWVVTGGQAIYTPAELVQASNGVPPADRPAFGVMSYSNTNFVILGMIAEKYGCSVGGNTIHCTYETLLKGGVLDPVGLNATALPLDEKFTIKDFSNGYGRIVGGAPVTGMVSLENPDADAYLPFTFINPSVPDTAGAMVSTVGDEETWITQLAGNKFHLLSPKTQTERLTMTVPGSVAGVPARYGLGIYYMRSMLDNADMLGHAGSIPGYTSLTNRRLDTETDYSANTATYALTDDFSALAVVWLLDRNVQSALGAAGSCPDSEDGGPPVTCAGVNVRQVPVVVRSPTTVKPSGKFFETYIPPASSSAAPTLFPAAVPTLASYIHGKPEIALQQKAALLIEKLAALAMTGNHSIGVDVQTIGGNVAVEGDITSTGFDVFGIRDNGQGNKTIVDGRVISSAVWWNPNLSLLPSVAMVARPDDTSAAFDIAAGASQGKLSIEGTVQTQRIKTAAIRAESGSGSYAIDIGSTGRVIGPILLAGQGAMLSILPKGRALYVVESGELIQQNGGSAPLPGKVARARTKSTPQQAVEAAMAPLDVRTASCRFGPALGVPGVNLRPQAIIEQQFATTLADPSNGAGPVMLSLAGAGNIVNIAGSLVGAIPESSQSEYTKSLIAVRDSGSENKLTVQSGGMIVGDIDMRGKDSSLRIDGTVEGNVWIADAVSLSGDGTIAGVLTVGGVPMAHYGTLKILPPPSSEIEIGSTEQRLRKLGEVPGACLPRG